MSRALWSVGVSVFAFGAFGPFAGCIPAQLVSLGSDEEGGVAAQVVPQGATPLADVGPPGPAAEGADAEDAGAGDATAGGTDAEDARTDNTDAFSGVCLVNPTFAGNPAPGMMRWMSSDLPAWQVCSGNVDVNPGFCTLAAPQGTTTYVGLPVGYAAFQYPISTSLSAALTVPLPAGSYSFSIDLGVAVSTLPRGGYGMAGGAPVALVIYGGSSPCAKDEELFRATVTNTDDWETYSGTLVAGQAFSNLVLVPTLTDPTGSSGRAGAYVVIGNFISTCN